MKIKRKAVKVFCCVMMLCLFAFCPVLAEENPDGQGGQVQENGQGSVSGGQMNGTVVQNPSDPGVEGGQADRNGANGLREITGMVTLADADTSDIDPGSGDGYTWSKQGDVYVLTLKNVHIKGEKPDPNGPSYAFKIELSGNADILVKTEGNQPSVLDGGIWLMGARSQYEFHLIFDNAALTVNGTVSGGSDQDWVTVRGGSKIAVRAFNLGSSAAQNAQITVDGSGSELRIGDGIINDSYDDGYTLVKFLRITGGAKLIAESPVGVSGEIELGKDSMIQIDGTPTLYAQFLSTGGFDPAVLEGIKGCLPSRYYLGEWTDNRTDGTGWTYYTVLKPDGTVATSLTLKWPEEEETTTAAPEEVKPDTGSSERHNHSDSPEPQATEQQPKSEPETETETESAAASDSTDNTGTKVLDASPYTGDRDGAGLWAACAISSAALCLAALQLKAGRGRQ